MSAWEPEHGRPNTTSSAARPDKLPRTLAVRISLSGYFVPKFVSVRHSSTIDPLDVQACDDRHDGMAGLMHRGAPVVGGS